MSVCHRICKLERYGVRGHDVWFVSCRVMGSEVIVFVGVRVHHVCSLSVMGSEVIVFVAGVLWGQRSSCL